MIFLALLLIHLLYDFHWQGSFIADYKSKSWFILGVHSITWGLCIYGVMYLFAEQQPWMLPFLIGTHFVIDAWKTRWTSLAPLGAALWIDQLLHLITLLIIWFGIG